VSLGPHPLLSGGAVVGHEFPLAGRALPRIPTRTPGIDRVSVHRIITIGTSAGGVAALQSIVAGLPADLPASIFVVMHVSADSPGLLPEILARAGALAVTHAQDGDAFVTGHVYVAPPDYHLLIEPSGRIRLSRGPKENRFRPAIDPLFRSAAHAFGPHAVGVVLTGALDDGTAGLWAVKRHGGVAVVQDPDDAFASSMPLSALRYVEVDHCLPAAEIGALLTRLSRTPLSTTSKPEVMEMDVETKLLLGRTVGDEAWALGNPSYYACPECHGTLQEIREGALVRYRCHVGHAYSIDSLLSDLTRRVSEALWSALRAIEETAKLLRQEAEHARKEEDLELWEQYLRKTKAAQMNADAVRAVAMRQEQLSRERLEQAGKG
jgi:two-component system chemotaxis response regulator CheB